MEGTHLNNLSVNFIRPASIVPDGINRARDICGAGPVIGLSIVQSIKCRQFFLVLLHQLRKLVQKPAALRCWSVEAPGSLESLFGSLDSEINIFGRSFRNFCNDVSIGYERQRMKSRIR